MNCKVEGCTRQLDKYGVPVEYCDYQQGRCPMQKKPFDWNNKVDRAYGLFVILFIPVIVGFVLYAELF